MMRLRLPRAVLFDLDGTLADTAPDLAAAVNLMRSARGLAAVPYEQLRPVASAGARGLLGAAFGISPDAPEFAAMRVEFLDNYAAAIAIHTSLFDGIRDMLDGLEQAGLQWGIVTNKPARFTDALVPLIGLGDAACVISGDTTPHAKPHPQPLLEAAGRIGLASEACWYVGDDLRDIQAGRAAGMATIGAGWGYCGNVDPLTWEADVLVESPLQLLALLNTN
ncbi:MAG TPA: phosphoglycolate phosphatase [Oxalobacteraceae bacterium]|nr:phosphoglycolate phosphatase [Oxalobacteraceae bacterium]